MEDPNYTLINETRLAAFCLAVGITKITVEFDGSGDSGSIEDAYFESSNMDSDEVAKLQLTLWVQGPRQFNEALKAWEDGVMEERLIAIGDYIGEFVDQEISATGVDWYNNEGGFGHWTWTPREGVKFEVNQRTSSYETAYSEERELGKEAA